MNISVRAQLGLVAVITVGALASTAFAGGGTIAAAPTVVVGQQQFGNTCAAPPCHTGFDFWKLGLISGDHVVVDWESTTQTDAGELLVYPGGTNDFSINNTEALQDFELGGNGHAESVFDATADGVYPIEFSADCCSDAGGGPYDFTVYVHHRVILSLPRLSRVTTTGSKITVQAHAPDGHGITASGLKLTLQGFWLKKWHKLGTQSPTNGVVGFPLVLPVSIKGSVVKLRVTAAGGGYLSAHTPTRAALVK